MLVLERYLQGETGRCKRHGHRYSGCIHGSEFSD